MNDPRIRYRRTMEAAVIQAMALFGLKHPFEEEDLRRESRRLLIAVHPDTAREQVGLTIDEVLEARHLLERYLLDHVSAGGGERARSGAEEAFIYYREGMRIYSEALDEYWKKRLRYSHLSEDAPYLDVFREKLKRAKRRFATVLEMDPGGLWTPDAVEEIARINVWLGL